MKKMYAEGGVGRKKDLKLFIDEFM
jgi:hypothetical protein